MGSETGINLLSNPQHLSIRKNHDLVWREIPKSQVRYLSEPSDLQKLPGFEAHQPFGEADLHLTMESPELGAVDVHTEALKAWVTARKLLSQQGDKATSMAMLDAMSQLVPRKFHRKTIKIKNTRMLRAVLDYVIFLRDPSNTDNVIQQRNRKLPHTKADVVVALRDIIPARSYTSTGIDKREVKANDVGFVVPAARSYLLELTEDNPEAQVMGLTIFDGATFDDEKSNKPHSNLSLISENSDSTILASSTSMTSEIDLIDLESPMTDKSTDTTASQMVDFFKLRVNPMRDAKIRTPLPTVEAESCQRSVKIKRSASETRGQESKRARFSTIFDEAISPDVPFARATPKYTTPKENGRGSTSKNETVISNFKESTNQILELLATHEDMISRLRQTLTAREEEIQNLETTVRKQRAELAKSIQGSVAVASLKEAKKQQTEKVANLEDENAVLKTLAKGPAVTEDEIKRELANVMAL